MLKAAQEQFLSDVDKVELCKQALLDKLESERVGQVLKYVKNRVNHYLSSNLFKEDPKNIDEMNERLSQISETIKPDKLYNDRIKLIDKAIKDKDYATALIYYNHKGMLYDKNTVGQISKEYAGKIIPLINKKPELQEHIKETYFNGFEKM